MSIKEMNEVAKKQMPYSLRLKIATKIRDFTDAAKSLKHKYSVEAFNNKDIFREPDSIGITMFYPNMNNPTHIRTAIFDISIGETEFEKQCKLIEKEFEKKIPELN